MAWINGLERKRFNEEQKRLAEQERGKHIRDTGVNVLIVLMQENTEEKT